MILETKPKPTPLIRDRFEIVDYATGSNTSGKNKIDLALGHSPLGFPENVTNALIKALKENPTQLLGNYPQPYENDLSPLIRQRFDLPDTTRVFFNGDGSYGLLAAMLNDLVSKKQIRSGAKVIGYGPQFTNITLLADRAEIPYEAVQPPLRLAQADKLSILTNHRKENTKPAIVYVDNPNNPTGDTAMLDELVDLANTTALNGDLLIIDEAYGDFIDDKETAMNLIEDNPHIVVLRSISKGIGLASPRLGYAVTSENLAHYYENIRLVFAVDGIAYLIAQNILKPDVLKSFLPKVREKTAEVKNYFIEQLQMVGLEVFPTHSDVSIFMAKGPENFYQKLMAVGVETEDGKTFEGTYADLDSSYVRIRVPATIEEVNEALARIATIK